MILEPAVGKQSQQRGHEVALLDLLIASKFIFPLPKHLKVSL